MNQKVIKLNTCPKCNKYRGLVKYHDGNIIMIICEECRNEIHRNKVKHG